MGKMNPRAYIKRYDENVKSAQKQLQAGVNSMDKDHKKITKSGRKTKKQIEVEHRQKEQASFLLFLEKEKNKEESSSYTSFNW